jgi:hypothetical protein
MPLIEDGPDRLLAQKVRLGPMEKRSRPTGTVPAEGSYPQEIAMTDMTFAQFECQLAKLLQEIPFGTSADLTAAVVAFWDGHQVTYLRLSEDGRLGDEFDFTKHEWDQWRGDLDEWIEAPVFTVRHELNKWLKDAPPYEAGM